MKNMCGIEKDIQPFQGCVGDVVLSYTQGMACAKPWADIYKAFSLKSNLSNH